jgi:hypothetical protein
VRCSKDRIFLEIDQFAPRWRHPPRKRCFTLLSCILWIRQFGGSQMPCSSWTEAAQRDHHEIEVTKHGKGLPGIYSRVEQTGLAIETFPLTFKMILLGE